MQHVLACILVTVVCVAWAGVEEGDDHGVGGATHFVECEPGENWITGSIYFECQEDPTNGSHGFLPIACVNKQKHHVLPGDTYDDVGRFRYQCRSDDNGTLVYEIINCFTPKGIEIAIGAEVEEGSGVYACERDQDANTVDRFYYTDPVCTDTATGKTYAVNEIWVAADGVSVLQCGVSNKKPKIIPYGCKLPDERIILVWHTAFSNNQSVLCQSRTNKPETKLTPAPLKCTDQWGGERAVNEMWVYDGVEYICDVKRGVPIKQLETEVRPRACVEELTYTEDDQSKTQHFKVFINQAKRAKNKKFYWCKEVAPGKFELVQIKKKQAKCDNGVKIDKAWVVKSVGYKCIFNKGQPKIIPLECVDPSGKRVPLDRIVSTAANEAHICEKQENGTYVYRKLTIKEYISWRVSGQISATSSSYGKGIKWFDKNGKPVCKEGYILVDDLCVDKNECLRGEHTCSEKERCRNVDGSFECLCNQGTMRNSESNQCKKMDCGCPE